MRSMKDELDSWASQILSDWAMMLVEHAGDVTKIFELDQPFYRAQLRFHGVISGRWVITCQQSFIDALTSNLLGEPAELGSGEGEDALKELVNVLSGNLLTSVYGIDTIFELEAPHCELTVEAEILEVLNAAGTVSLTGDNAPIAISFVPERF